MKYPTLNSLRAQMNPNQPTTLQSTAVANALRGEKAWKQVEFATTGDNETDAISGILAVLQFIAIGPHAEARVLSYLAKRSEEGAAHLDKLGDWSKGIGQQQMGYSNQTNSGMAAPPSSGLPNIAGLSALGNYPLHNPGSSLMDDYKGPFQP